ncbi:hypothetical protein B0H19DRAFT_118944 [Mycena capillaripes]|nr:hypothetical protein B0H19DRAFT_118944 [Mycena capillaripes]
MSFITRGTHPVSFQGGTFNNVAGDLNIFSSVSGPRASCPHNDLDRKDEVGPVRNRRILRETQRPYHKHHPIAPTHSNSTFNTVGGNMTNVSVTSYGGNGLDILYYSVLQDAMHNSAERPPEPSCHPGTRNSTLDNLRKWSEDDRTEGSFLWLYGCAGIGKSSIAQSFAATCQEKGILGATFFFKRGDPGRGNWKGLIPTLAYQLAASVGELHGAIRSAVENDKLVVGQTMRHQFQKLLIAPFEQTSLTIPPILVVDGLDECEDHGVQVMLLKLIIEGLRAGTLPIRLLLASRPEAHLREVLQADDNFDICRHLELCPDAAAYADIRRYLCDEFVRIRQCQTSRGIQLENDWPGDDSIDHLVGKSSGTFIYAATVMRYVDDEYSHPAERLESVLGLDPLSTVPLDNLYKQILSTVPNRPMLRRVLHAIVRTNADWDPEEIDVALQVRAGTSRLILRGLHSLVFVPPVRTIGFRYAAMFLHASLDDFLLDPARSADLCVATLELDSGLVHSMVVFLSTSPTDPLLITTIAAELLQCIVRIDLTDDLLPVLRNVDVQQVSYSSLQTICRVLEWLKFSAPFAPRSDMGRSPLYLRTWRARQITAPFARL